jgi:hypothetical protein
MMKLLDMDEDAEDTEAAIPYSLDPLTLTPLTLTLTP